MRRRLRRAAVTVAASAALALVACGGGGIGDGDDDGADIPTLEITGIDYGYEAPAGVPGGLTSVRFENAAATEDHQAQLVRLNDGVTFDDFTAALESAESEADILGLGTLAGGPGAGAGGLAEATIDLEPGTYAVLCLIPSPEDGVPHVAKGMIASLEVAEPEGDQPEPPVADVSVALQDFEFDIPSSLAAGVTTFGVVNNGPQPHEIAFIRAEEGVSYQDVLDIILVPPGSAPPPAEPPLFAFAGQMAVLSDGGSGFTTINLAPGTYALLCFVTDPETGAPHAVLGMAQELTVE
jgi:hypothetical protein